MAKLPHFTAVKDSVAIRGYSQRVRNLANEVDIRAVVSALDFLNFDPAGREFNRKLAIVEAAPAVPWAKPEELAYAPN